MHRHSRPSQPLDRVIRTSGICDNPIVGVGNRVGPPLGMRGFVQSYGVDRYFQINVLCRTALGLSGVLSVLSHKTRSPVFAYGDQAATQRRPVQRVMTVEEKNLGELSGKLADAQRIRRPGCAALLNLPQ